MEEVVAEIAILEDGEEVIYEDVEANVEHHLGNRLSEVVVASCV